MPSTTTPTSRVRAAWLRRRRRIHRRGLPGQLRQRLAALAARRAAVAYAESFRAAGLRAADACELLGQDPRTLRRWSKLVLKPAPISHLGPGFWRVSTLL